MPRLVALTTRDSRYVRSIFRLVAIQEPRLWKGSSIDQLTSATVESAFEQATEPTRGLTCDEFIEWLDSTASAKLETRPSAVKLYNEFVNQLDTYTKMSRQ